MSVDGIRRAGSGPGRDGGQATPLAAAMMAVVLVAMVGLVPMGAPWPTGLMPARRPTPPRWPGRSRVRRRRVRWPRTMGRAAGVPPEWHRGCGPGPGRRSRRLCPGAGDGGPSRNGAHEPVRRGRSRRPGPRDAGCVGPCRRAAGPAGPGGIGPPHPGRAGGLVGTPPRQPVPRGPARHVRPERGLAVDIARSDVPTVLAVAAQAGLCRPLPDTDPVHFVVCPGAG